jgi:hypothetical protein
VIYRTTVTLTVEFVIDANTRDQAERDARNRALSVALTPHNVYDLALSPMAVTEMIERDHHKQWQEHAAARLGTPNQLARFERGVLPEAELLTLARNELFEPFSLFLRRRRMVDADIHDTEPCAGSVIWSTTPNPKLTDRQWRTWRDIQDALNTAMQHPWLYLSSRDDGGVQMLEHRGTCPACQGQKAHQSALVSIVWAGRTLSREYLL